MARGLDFVTPILGLIVEPALSQKGTTQDFMCASREIETPIQCIL